VGVGAELRGRGSSGGEGRPWAGVGCTSKALPGGVPEGGGGGAWGRGCPGPGEAQRAAASRPEGGAGSPSAPPHCSLGSSMGACSRGASALGVPASRDVDGDFMELRGHERALRPGALRRPRPDLGRREGAGV